MTIEKRIQAIIATHFGEDSFVLKNESHKHAGHAGDDGTGQTHFQLEVTSGAFNGMSRVESQRHVYALLNKEFEDGLHALSLKIKTP